MLYLERAILQSSVEVHGLTANHSFVCVERVRSACDLAVGVFGGLGEPKDAVRLTVACGSARDTYSAKPLCKTPMPTGAVMMMDLSCVGVCVRASVC